ncbi:MAG: hypothetical protein GY730_03410 [bacterium]|nr:hypothetical protein [bacterium]
MNEILGLLDSLEAAVLESKRIPFTDKVILEEKTILQLVDKIRLVLNNEGSFARKVVDVSNEEKISDNRASAIEAGSNLESGKLLYEAENEAEKIKEGANEYADYVLANLQLMLAKMQKNLVTLEKNIESGRDILDETKNKAEKEGNDE